MIDRRIIITIAVTIFLLLGLVGAYAIAVSNSSPAPQQTSVTKTDTTTGETYSPQVGSTDKAPFFLGVKELITYGMSASDVDILQSNLSEYFISQKDYVPQSKIAVDKNTYKQMIRPESTIVDYSFTIIVNDKEKYVVKLHTDGLSSRTMELALTDDKVLKTW